jgi:recombination protein RecA
MKVEPKRLRLADLPPTLPPRAKPAPQKKGKASVPFAVGLVNDARSFLKSKKMNEASVRLLSEGGVLSEVTEWIPTGFVGLDYILGGGWAVGRCSEVYGPEGSGKSALSHRAIRACQDNGGVAIHLDFERALDPPKMKQLGIDPTRLVYEIPECIEDAWDLLWRNLTYIEANMPEAPTLIVWDSVAQSVPKAELKEKGFDDAHVGLIARAMSKGCRRVLARIDKTRAHLMWINQERDRIGGKPWQDAVTPGGKAIRYATSMRVRVCNVSTGKDAAGLSTHYLVRSTTKKCRLFPPHRKMTWVLDFKHGPSPELTLFQGLIDERVIKSAGNVYKVPWSKTNIQRSAWIGLMQDPAWKANAEAAYLNALKDANAGKMVEPTPSDVEPPDDEEDAGAKE